MDVYNAVDGLNALAHPTRLEIFRLLVRHGTDGLPAGDIGQRLQVKPNTLSAQLSLLRQADLLRSQRDGRNIWYRVNFDAVRGLLTYLMRDCCQGDPTEVASAVKQCCGETNS